MSATDELRKLLEEHGIKHFDYDKGGRTQTMWEATDGKRHFTYETYNNPAKTAKLVISWFPTPEQAIAATLGSDAKPCYATDYTHDRCKYSVNRGWTEDTKFYVPTSAERTCKAIPHLNLTIGKDFLTQNGLDCSECGGRLDLPVRAFYCPNCGAKVVER